MNDSNLMGDKTPEKYNDEKSCRRKKKKKKTYAKKLTIMTKNLYGKNLNMTKNFRI